MNNQQTNSAERVDYLKSEMARYAARLDYVQALKIFSELVNLAVKTRKHSALPQDIALICEITVWR